MQLTYQIESLNKQIEYSNNTLLTQLTNEIESLNNQIEFINNSIINSK